MSYIIWSNSINEYPDLYKETRQELIHLTYKVLLHAKVKLMKKLFILVACIAPKILAKIILKRKEKRFNEDVMN